MTVDELIAALDAKFPAWEMWRTADAGNGCLATVTAGQIHGCGIADGLLATACLITCRFQSCRDNRRC